MIVHKPWGYYTVLYEASNGLVVKEIVVFAGQRLSLQRHKYRHEHWYFVSGTGIFTLEENTYLVEPWTEGEIPTNMWHRIKANEESDLIFIEVQSGMCREDDIERLQDDYERA